MTSWEIESRTGMRLENIRFYEREGLLTPKRKGDYSQEDLQFLLKVKLLRSLQIPLEEIRALRDGRVELSETLLVHIARLEREYQELSGALEICRAMRDERSSFATLDAGKYLQKINSLVGESRYLTISGDELPVVQHPWRRFLARELDFFLCRVLWSMVLVLVFRINFTARSLLLEIFDSYVSLVILLFTEPLWLSTLGATPGKLIFGLRVESTDGGRLSYLEGLGRTWGVIGKGMGYNIPIYYLYRLYVSYRDCKSGVRLEWDYDLPYSISDTKWFRGVIYIAAYFAAFGLLLVLNLSLFIPPNRDSLTIDEFEENFDYFAELVGVSYVTGNEPLAITNSYGMILNFDVSKRPEFVYDTVDGKVRSVSFSVTETDRSWVVANDTDMLLTALSLICASRDVGIFSGTPASIERQIKEHTFSDFEITQSGVRLICDVEYTGYIDTQSGILAAIEENKAKYYSLSFSAVAE